MAKRGRAPRKMRRAGAGGSRGARTSGFASGRAIPIRGSRGRFAGSKSIGTATASHRTTSYGSHHLLTVKSGRTGRKFRISKNINTPFTPRQAQKIGARVIKRADSGRNPGRPSARRNTFRKGVYVIQGR